MTNIFVKVVERSFDSNVFRQKHTEITEYVWEGQGTVARLHKEVDTFPDRVERVLPWIWETRTITYEPKISYNLYVRTKQESTERDAAWFDCKTDEEAFAKAFEWLERRRFR